MSRQLEQYRPVDKSKEKPHYGFLAVLICRLFHKKHHQRTGRRQLRTAIAYDEQCDKCGMCWSVWKNTISY